ncbi:MAG: hypothetical protein RBQ97_02550 [Acholeplasma sp.]|nr:hypothetical protein [Acholeplasma sp.]
MKNKIIYGSIAVLFLIVIFFISLFEITIREQNNLTNEIFSNAKNTKDFDDFVAYQAAYYDYLEKHDANGYSVTVYNAVEDNQSNHFLVIIIPDNYENIEFADNNSDVNDNTQVTFIINQEIVFDTKKNYPNVAISYGYSNENFGYIFFDYEILNTTKVNVEYRDYHGSEINNFEIDFVVTKDDFSTFSKGYTREEIQDRLDLTNKLKKEISVRIMIYLIIVIALPFLYKLIKTIILNKKEKNNN